MIPKDIKLKNKKLPDSPGVYLFKNNKGDVLYVGKAGNLKRRVESYFSRPHDARIEKLVTSVKQIGYKKTDTALEALILEAKLIRKFSPPFNVKEKDDKSFLYIEITKEKFPRVLLVRGRDINGKRLAPSLIEHSENRSAREREERSAQFSAGFGPFISASNIRHALKILRKIFPFSVHEPSKLGKFKRFYPEPSRRACFDYELGLCPGTCIGVISEAEYRKNIKNLTLFFEGKKKKIITALTREMKMASRHLEFEKAEKLRRQLFALQHVRDIALIAEDGLNSKFYILNSRFRIEGYDVSNISGTSAVGSMVVFMGNEPDKNEYRKFRVRTIIKPNDVGMLKEILYRRFAHNWPLPNLVLIDGGIGQVNAAKIVLREFGLKIPVVGIAKGPKRKKNEFFGVIPDGVEKKTLIRVRNEAHRFAIAYHKKVRNVAFI